MSNKRVPDHQFHQDSINALKAQDPSIALIFGFETTQRRSLAANLLCLSGELENAIRIPKEPMLAAIRVQWWYDTLVDEASAHQPNIAPLVVRLRTHIHNDDIKRDDVLKLIEAWQACTMDETASSADAWSACWQLIGRYLGDDEIGVVAQKIGGVLHGQKMPNTATTQSLDSAYLKALRFQVLKNRQWWLYFAAIIGYRRQSGNHVESDDHLLVWRLLGWRLFGFNAHD
ncbi:MAG: hypothetical protein ACPHZ5_06165 [Candidatus Puniceispirillum sp.]